MILDELKSRIPSMKCPDGCHECCGPVLVSKEELKSIPKSSKTPSGFDCVYLKRKRCSIYENRPMICRAFGTIANAGFLKCPKGILPAEPLTPNQIFDIMDQYLAWAKKNGGMYELSSRKRSDIGGDVGDSR